MADILHRVGIKAPLDEVYKALATRDGVAGWWTNNTQGESQMGGVLTFRFTAAGAELGHSEVKVLELQPNQQVLWQVVGGTAPEWIGTKIGFELKQDGEYVIVLFKHQGWKEPVEFMHHCSTKWAIFLMSLKQLVETGKGLPNPYDTKIDNWN
ncbi:MAG TPA: SRPBCC domain-containing protein [Albitalea sp.]|nr:SRPBCC domain-containing protein [Albitalea sp.]